jgi:elongation factor G
MTTLSERILFTPREHKLAKSTEGGATMVRNGNRSGNAASPSPAPPPRCYWKNKRINLIDTPGHVRLHRRSERSLRSSTAPSPCSARRQSTAPERNGLAQAQKYQFRSLRWSTRWTAPSRFDGVVHAIHTKAARLRSADAADRARGRFQGVIDVLEKKWCIFSEED